MYISILSDSHDNWHNLEKAVAISNQERCSYLLFAGDLIAPPGIEILAGFNGDVKFVWGNNEGEKMGMTRAMDRTSSIELCGDFFDEEIAGLRVFMAHLPKFAELAAMTGKYDLCIHGHTHLFREEVFGKTLLINPGELHGYKTKNPAFIVFDTSSLFAKKISLNEK